MLFKTQVGTPAILAKVYAVASAEKIKDHSHPWCSQSHEIYVGRYHESHVDDDHCE
jgi:hypothetical protein